ncbi:protein arginine N-methyltransferase 9-like [Contarinia nasturtii]|uniref:protein arginine N-methyltransferase 9-like n=1 Tax=Contarinia nasturtii TaxID=265458 RepID=UPI0012D4AF75|nr:protein arginine N-methyltransferase 9-like [Contarinia nasturtii]
MEQYEDNLIGLDDQNEFQRIFPFVLVEPNKENNLDEIFPMIVNRPIPNNQQNINNKLTPEDLNRLDRFGTALARNGNLLAAQCCFEKILSIEPNYLKSYQNLDNVKNRLVERWHFGMLNDADRNKKYKAAITKAIQQRNQVSVLDIGTGTGLFALYAKEAGATQIAACDSSSVMCQMASEAFHRNGCGDQIKLIAKHSNKLNAELDLGGKVDLVVTETMDCGVFGEGLLDTLINAKEFLLKANGQIIPARVKLYIAGFQSTQLAMESNVINTNSFTDTIFLQNYTLSSNNQDEPYDSCYIEQLTDFTLITKVEEALSVDLNNLDQMYSLMNGQITKDVRLAYNIPESILDGFCVWFEMSLDPEETIIISTDPRNHNASIGEQQCCWETAIFRLKHRFTNTQKLQNLNVTVSAANGILALEHYYDTYAKSYTGLTTEMVRFLNDIDLIDALEFEAFAEITRRFGTIKPKPRSPLPCGKPRKPKPARELIYIDNVLDFSPFPSVGIALLKEKRLKKLYCSREACNFVTFISKTNCISMNNIVFIDDPHDALFVSDVFDLIILPLIDHLGALISSNVANYGLLKDNKLTKKGFMMPDQVDVYCNVIQSRWLRTFCRVTQPEIVDRLQIGSLINKYATTLHLDLPEFLPTCKTLYEAFHIGSLRLNDEFYSSTHELFVGLDRPVINPEPCSSSSISSGGSYAIHGILYYFHLILSRTSADEAISTKRNNSFARLGCFMFNENEVHKENGYVNLTFRQNSGVMKIDV